MKTKYQLKKIRSDLSQLEQDLFQLFEKDWKKVGELQKDTSMIINYQQFVWSSPLRI
jgi:hypothetical protein